MITVSSNVSNVYKKSQKAESKKIWQDLLEL